MKKFLPKKENLPLLEQHKKWSLHYQTGHNLEWYMRRIGRPVLYLVVLNLVVHMTGALPMFGEAYFSVFIPIVFLVELATYAIAGARSAKHMSTKSLPHHMKGLSAAITGFFIGGMSGVLIALFKIFWFREFWTLFNVVNEPVVRGITGFIFAGVVGLLVTSALVSKHRKM